MSPRRRHGGGRPRSANSVLDLAERWGISEKSARRLAARILPDEAMAILVAECKRYRAAQIGHAAHGKYPGSLKALGMKSRVPARRYREEGYRREPGDTNPAHPAVADAPESGA